MKEPLVDIVDTKPINSNKCKILDLNLLTMHKEDIEFSNYYEL